MNDTLLKICGITRLEDARYCAAAGADMIGFIQHRSSPRFVDPAKIREISEWLYGPRTVGVFVDADPDEVNRIASECQFDFVQLHGSESPAYCSLLDTPVIKAVHIRDGVTTADEIRRAVGGFTGVADYILFDTGSDKARGGTGLTFSWDILQGVDVPIPFFLAGGISANNVAAALASVNPAGLDVSSSVESSPGIKDFDLLGAFFEAFESAAASSAGRQ